MPEEEEGGGKKKKDKFNLAHMYVGIFLKNAAFSMQSGLSSATRQQIFRSLTQEFLENSPLMLQCQQEARSFFGLPFSFDVIFGVRRLFV